ncbi:DNA recombination protein RmuC [Endomicrobium proavitum]|uniref:DNA recombination protein RmuC n=1 Tax=Endomicrobium proavitum TaxID=1408281 RepID=UPI0006975F25|nr:DNA recombination protein RmuC [Endomicrobium proavitum]
MSIFIAISCFVFGALSAAIFFIYKSSAKTQKIKDLQEDIQKRANLEESLKTEFENIASKVLEQKNSKISDLNKQALENVVSPFKEKIKEFQDKVEKIHNDQSQQQAVLNSELKRLMELNKQVSEEANNLAEALKGENKIQGNWGELNIERIFEAAGMLKGTHYEAQKSFADDNGRKIPDYIVNLPEGKHIVVDSKTSLTAYEKYFNAENADDKKVFLKEHISSIKKHIDELSGKNYQDLEELNQPDYILMFVPVDAAAALAMREDSNLAEYAFKKHVVITTPSTFLATLKIISYMWRQENQKKNVLEIAKQGGLLYDRFVDFVQVLEDTDELIGKAKSKTEEAKRKLSNPDRKGDSLIGRAEKLKELGAPVKKQLK